MDSGKVLCKLLASIAEQVSHMFLGKVPPNGVLEYPLVFLAMFQAFMFFN